MQASNSSINFPTGANQAVPQIFLQTFGLGYSRSQVQSAETIVPQFFQKRFFLSS